MALQPPDPIYVLRGSSSEITSVKFFPLNDQTEEKLCTQLAAGNQEGFVFIWDLRQRGIHKKWKAHTNSILWLHPLDANSIWTEGRHESAILWNLTADIPVKVYVIGINQYLGFSPCALSKDKNQIAVPGPDNSETSIYNVSEKEQTNFLLPKKPENRGMVITMQWVDGKKRENLIVVYESRHISLWDVGTKGVLSEIKVTGGTPVSFGYNEIMGSATCGTASNDLVHIIVSEESLTINNSLDITNHGVASVDYRPDGKIFASGGWDAIIRLFKTKKHRALAALKYHKDSIECIAYSTSPVESFGKGYILAAGSKDRSISLWNLYNNANDQLYL